MLEFEELAFKQAVTYCDDNLTTIPLKDQNAVYIGGLNGSGKAQPLYSKIKVPNGWKTMGEMKIGDIVSTPDGKTASIIRVFSQGIRPTYRVTFEDGRTTDCDENHLWKVYSHGWCYRRKKHKIVGLKDNPEKILSLKEILERKSKSPLFVPLSKPVFNNSKDLPLDPYVLGALLGDGGLTRCVTFTNVDKENFENLKSRLIKGYYLKNYSKKKNYHYRIVPKPEYRQDNKDGSGVFNYYVKVLKDLNLYGKCAWTKFIPKIYKEASIEQRLELLRGLMDTSGEVSFGKPVKIQYKRSHAGGNVSYSTSSHQLALDVQYLVRSLGGLCTIRIKRSYYKTKEGIQKECRTHYKCCIRHKNPELLIKLPRKKERAVRSQSIMLRCKIKSIKYLGIQPTQCIMIDHPDHLYITDGFTVTHNSLPFNILYNVLFGYTPLSSKGKRKLIANSGYYAHVKFKLNNVPYEIRQFFNNPDFEYEGYDILKNGQSLKIGGGIPEAEKYIAKLLPFTAEEFCSFYYLSQDGLHVLAYGRGSERLAYLSKVFGFDIYDEIRAKLKVKLDEVDNQLTNICKVQENIDQLEEYLKKFPSLELLEKRIEICTHYLEKAKEERLDLQLVKSDIENKITIFYTRENIKESIKKYGIQRALDAISSDISKWQMRQSSYQVYLKQFILKKNLLKQFSIVKNYLKEDVNKLYKRLDSLIKQRGKATLINKQIKQKRDLISKIDQLNLSLKHKDKEISYLAKNISKSLIEKRALLKQKKISIADFTDLSKDGQVCTRCGQLLNSEHIKKELQKLSTEVSELNLLIKNLEVKDKEIQRDVKILQDIEKYQGILESMLTPSETLKNLKLDIEIDIKALDAQIQQLRKQLSNSEEAQRLKKELQTYTKYDKIKAQTINTQLPKIQAKLKKLQEEFGCSREKQSLITQLNKISVVNEEEIKESNLSKVTKKLEIYDELIPLIASDIREFTTIKTTVKDYLSQIQNEIKKVSEFDKLTNFRKIVNTCYKAYMPAHLKKIQVSKVSELIAQKLNVFVPLIFNEDITFTVNSNENSVDILFKRGDHPARDVRFLNGGFKKRFLIALIPTLAGLISARKRANLIILDEIEANVDGYGREAIGEFLIPFLKTKFKTILVISPSIFSANGNLEASVPLDHFDKIWVASYKNGSSSLKIKG